MRGYYWLCLGGLLYGSLFPFNFVIPDIHDVDVDEFFSGNSVTDVLSNILLFVPIGVLARLSGKENRKTTRDMITIAVLAAITAQLLQVFVPGRYPGLLDMLMNILGLALGVRFAPRIEIFVRRYWTFKINMPVSVMFLVSAFIVSQLFPFVPTFDIGSFKRSIWALLRANEIVDAHTIITQAAGWFIFCTLAYPAIEERRLQGLVFLSPVLFFGARLIIADNVATMWLLYGGILGVMIYVPFRKSAAIRLISIFVITGVIFAEGLLPFIPRAQPINILSIPFWDIIYERISVSIPMLAWKVYLYGSLLFLLWQRVDRTTLSMAVVAIFLFAIEIIQTRYTSGIPSMTDPVLVILLGLGLKTLMTRSGQPGTDYFLKKSHVR